MKVAIIGVVYPTVTYHYWETVFHRYFRKNGLSEINITGGDTLLNRYARTYADKFAIHVSEYCLSDDSAEARLRRNTALIQNSDSVVAFTTNRDEMSLLGEMKISLENEKRALVVNTDDPVPPTSELPSSEDEMALVNSIRLSDADSVKSEEKLKNFYRRFVRMIAWRYVTEHNPIGSLIAEGNIGLIHAARKYDPACGFRFLPYAVYWIKQSIEESIHRN